MRAVIRRIARARAPRRQFYMAMRTDLRYTPVQKGAREAMKLLIIAILLAVSAASAQSQRASISGEVTDSAGAVTVGANVTATNIETNVAATAIANTAGFYVISNLESGSYSVTFQHACFRRFHETG